MKNSMEDMEQEAPASAPMTAHEISGELMEEASMHEAQAAGETEAAIREGIAALFEDGWTQEELAALSQDAGVRTDIARGLDVIRAACAYLRRQMTQRPLRRPGVPVSRVSSAGGGMQGSGIEQMSDAQFEQFSRQAREAAMMGRKVRM